MKIIYNYDSWSFNSKQYLSFRHDAIEESFNLLAFSIFLWIWAVKEQILFNAE